jgi:hypothetical protein
MNNNIYVIDYVFSDGSRMKYVVDRNNFYEAKNEAQDAKNSWNSSSQSLKINDLYIKEIKNENFKRQKSSDNPRHTSKSKVRKHNSEPDEEYD